MWWVSGSWGFIGGLWGCEDGSPFCVWSWSGYSHAHRATAVVHLVEALITTPPTYTHTHTHTLQQHRTRSVSHLRFFNCRCSLYEHFMYNIYFLSFLQSSFCRNESPFLLETLRCLKPHQKPYAIRSAKFTPLWLLIRNNLSEIRHIHGPSLSWPSALCTKKCPRRTNPALQMSLHA